MFRDFWEQQWEHTRISLRAKGKARADIGIAAYRGRRDNSLPGTSAGGFERWLAEARQGWECQRGVVCVCVFEAGYEGVHARGSAHAMSSQMQPHRSVYHAPWLA